MKTAYDIWKDAPKYQLPHEAEAFKAEWWTAEDAARAWNVTAKTAKRYMQLSGEQTTVIVRNVRRDRVRILQCVRVGTPAPKVRRGNPRFADPEWQRSNAAKRWEGHITHKQLQQYKAEMEAAAFEEAVEFARLFVPDGDS